MRGRRLVIGIVVVAALAAGGYWAYGQFLAPADDEPAESDGTDVNTVSVATELDVVAAEGEVVPLADTRLSFPLGGEIAQVLVAEGDSIPAGAPLIRLDSTDQEIAVAQANAAVVQAEANRQTAAAGVLAAEAGLTAAEVAVDAARAQVALLTADPSTAALALGESNVAVAEAGVIQAAGSRDAALEGASGAAIAAAEAQVAAAQAQYDAAIRAYQPITQDEGAEDEDREQAQLQINVAQANLNAAQAALNRLRSGPTRAAQVAANSGVAVAANQSEAARANLDLLLAGPREQQIAAAEAAVAQAESQLEEAELQLANAETAVVRAQAALVEAQAGLAIANRELEKRTLTAPFAATVAAVAVKEHEVAAPAAPVITLADFGAWHIETTDLTEVDVVNIARDFPVEITLDAFPGTVLTGRVTDIAAISDITRGDVTFVTTIALDDDQDLPLRWGMTAFVSIDTQ